MEARLHESAPQAGPSNRRNPHSYRSKSLEKIKYSKQTTPTLSPNSSFQLPSKPNMYLKNKKPRYGLSQSSPTIDANKSFSGTKTPRTTLYLKRSQLANQSRSAASSSHNSLQGCGATYSKSRSKSESNLTFLIRKSNQQRMAEINLSESLNNREIMELIRPGKFQL